MVQSFAYISRPTPIYTNGIALSAEIKAGQIRHLALIGIAASDSAMNVANLQDAMLSLFEVIARLAEEVANDIDIDAMKNRHA